jgi:DNA-binding beta-propeller fold protein YncE
VRNRKSLAALVVAVAVATPLAAQEKTGPLKLEKELTVEGTEFFDYLTVDAAGERLYLAHSPRVDVIDLKTGKTLGSIDGVNGAHGIALVPDLKRGFATAGKKGKVFVFDLETLKTIKEVTTGENPDAVMALRSAKEVWTFNGKSKDVTCLDPETLATKATIKLEGKPEAAAEDAEKGLIYVNIEDKSSVTVIDVKKHEVVGAPWKIAPGESPSGLALDRKNGLVFSVCENKKVTALDVATGKIVATADIGAGCDGAVFDPATGNIYASCGQDAKTTVVHVKDAHTLEVVGALDTAPGARTCTLDEKTHKLYVAGCKKGEKVKVLIFAP